MKAPARVHRVSWTVLGFLQKPSTQKRVGRAHLTRVGRRPPGRQCTARVRRGSLLRVAGRCPFSFAALAPLDYALPRAPWRLLRKEHALSRWTAPVAGRGPCGGTRLSGCRCIRILLHIDAVPSSQSTILFEEGRETESRFIF